MEHKVTMEENFYLGSCILYKYMLSVEFTFLLFL